MKSHAVCLFVISGLIFCGCGVELLTTTAVQGELQAQQLSAMRGQVQSAANQTGKINLERAIKTYQAEHGAYPPSLDVLAPNYIPAVPVKADGTQYGYDPSTGQLLDTASPAPAVSGPSAQDSETMANIQDAIARCGAETGYYPAALDDLYPHYLPMPPRTAAGEEFVYDNQTGAIRHPHQTQAAAPARRPAHGGMPSSGAGPMGEAMTGIGIQQELNSMGQSATNAAGSYARQSVRGVSEDRTQQQNKTMDDLGL